MSRATAMSSKPMAVHRRVNIDLPEAKRLIDLRGIQSDLRFCLDGCRLYRHALEKEPGLIPQCIAQAVIIRYARCFNKGRRQAGNADLRSAFDASETELHQFFYDLRDRHFGHPVSGLETAQLTVLLNPEERGRKILSLEVISSFINAPSLEDFGKLEQLLNKLIQHVDVQASKEEAKLMPLVESRYPLEKIYSHKGKPYHWAPVLDPSETRTALRRNKP